MKLPEAARLDIGFWFPRPERGARLAEELRRLGHSVTVYHSLPVPGDQAHVRKVAYDFVSGLRKLRSLRHDVMYTSRSFLPVLQLRIARWLTGRPYVYTLNGAIWAYYAERSAPSKIAPAQKALYPFLLRQAVAGAAAVVANSRFLADALRSKFPASASKVTTIYNGIDYEAIDGGSPRPDAWPPGPRRVLSVVTMNFDRKSDGVRLLLDAFDMLCEHHPRISFLIAAKTDNAPMVARLRRHLEGLRCAAKARIDVNRPDVPDLLATADLFLYATPPDSSDSLPRALLEAQAAGVPTVTTDTTGCGEVVLSSETGVTVPYDPAEMARAAAHLIRNPDLARRMAARGRDVVRERFNWESMAKAYESLFLQAAPVDPPTTR